MIEEKTYADKVNDWLNADPETRSLEVGAKLMLQGNRNRILHENVIRRKNFEKIEYELTKIIGSDRNIDVTVNIPDLEVKVTKIEGELEKVNFEGKRPDHDTLPADIQLIPEKNRDIYREMRSLFEKLKVLNEEGHTSTERLPVLTELLKMEALLTSNWSAYDTFDMNAPVIIKAEVIPGTKIDAKRVSANRKYLSDNKAKLMVLISDGKTDKAAELLERMQIRYNELIMNGETFSDDQTAELGSLGLIVGVTLETEKEPAAINQVITETEEKILPAGENTEETHEENVISQIKTLLKNNIAKEVIISTIASLGKFGELVLTPEVVEELYNKAVDQEINSVE